MRIASLCRIPGEIIAAPNSLTPDKSLRASVSPQSGETADVSLSIALAHIVLNDDGTSTGVWGPFTLKTAFQPIFAFRNGKLSIAAFEALVRPFRHDVPVAPPTFFSTLPAVDRFSVETLTRTLHLLNAAACLPREAAIFVNFDPSVFIDRQVADAALADMRGVLSTSGIDPQRVVCEVTEQRSASQEALYQLVARLKANGFRIAVDDYGSEESDINRIRALRPDIVKFDALWITRLMESGPGFGLLSAMVDIFAKQGIQTVFEGIEENWLARTGREVRCLHGSGLRSGTPGNRADEFFLLPSRHQPCSGGDAASRGGCVTSGATVAWTRLESLGRRTAH
jgi:EAL domain-containing protein (putative c-di-GMP-specific phosphodiesterase class I)